MSSGKPEEKQLEGGGTFLDRVYSKFDVPEVSKSLLWLEPEMKGSRRG